MKYKKLISILSIITLLYPTIVIIAKEPVTEIVITQDGVQYSSSQVLIKFKSTATSTDINAVKRAYGMTTNKKYNIGVELMDANGHNIEKLMSALSQNKHIEFIQPNYIYQLPESVVSLIEETEQISEGISTNDTYSSRLWGMDVIDAPEAWSITEGSGVVVAVIDSGIMYNHEDLADNMWVNPDEIANNGIDDDDNGYIDDIHGWNVLDENGEIFETALDANGYFEDMHGTHVAGTIAAVGNNSIGVVGVAPKAKIMSLKFFGSNSRSGYTSEAIQAIEYATDNGAQVINASWGSYSSDSALDLAISNFPGIFVAAAGNDGRNTDRRKHYPSSSPASNILSIASIDGVEADQPLLSSFSNYGTNTVDIGAPGGTLFDPITGKYSDYIVSAYPYTNAADSKYISMAGTSMATPHVVGVIALMLSMEGNNPRSTAALISDVISSSVYDSRLSRIKYSSVINSFNAVSGGTIPINNPPVVNPINTTTYVDSALSFTLSGFDADNDSLIFELDTTGLNGSIDYNPITNLVTYTPEAGFIGPDSFKYRANDGTDSSAYAFVIIQVIEQPVIVIYDLLVTNTDATSDIVRNKTYVSDSATVLVTETGTNTAIPGVTVSATWSGFVNSTVTGVTDRNGEVVFTITDKSAPRKATEFESTLEVVSYQ